MIDTMALGILSGLSHHLTAFIIVAVILLACVGVYTLARLFLVVK